MKQYQRGSKEHRGSNTAKKKDKDLKKCILKIKKFATDEAASKGNINAVSGITKTLYEDKLNRMEHRYTLDKGLRSMVKMENKWCISKMGEVRM